MKKQFGVLIGVRFLIFALIMGISLQGCEGGTGSPPSQDAVADLSGAYLFCKSITADSLYADSEDAPVFIFTDTDLVIFQRDFAHYSPRSSLGRYYGSRSTYAKTELKAVNDPLALLASANVDTSAIQSCQGYIVSENQLAYFIVDGQVWMMQYRRQSPFVFSVVKDEQLELQTVDLSLAKEEEEKVVLVDTSAPQMLDIEGESVTKQDVLDAIGVSERDAGILVSYNRWTTDGYEEYIVFEFEGDTLRSRAEYKFYYSDDSYAASKAAAAITNGACNDALRLLKTTYAYDVDLRMQYRGLDYDKLEDALKEARFTIICAVTPNYKSLGSFSFVDVSHLEFWFGSGAGAWCTVLTVHNDGTFEGEYRDSDVGSMWLCNFTGKFSEPIKVNDYTYSVWLEQIKLEGVPGTEEIKDGIKLMYSNPYGLDDAEELLFYLPGAPVRELPEGYQSWMRSYGDYIGTELPFYGLYNVNGEQGYSSHISDNIRALDESAQAAYADLLLGDFSLLEDARTWGYPPFPAPSGDLEYATMDLDGDGISELLVQQVDAPSGYNAVFHYADGKLFCWNNDMVEMSCRDYPLQDGTMVRQHDYNGTRSYTLFRYQPDGGQEELSHLFARDTLIYDDGKTPCPYYNVDGGEVDETAFDVRLEELVVKQLLDRTAWTTI